MKPIHLLSLVQAHKSLDAPIYTRYADQHGIQLKPKEVQDIDFMVTQLTDAACDNKLLDGYFVGYSIPQIGKEFDLLRFGVSYNVNIEIKSDFDAAKILKQLTRNKYYLSCLEKPLHSIAYSSLNNSFFRLVEHRLEELDASEVRRILQEQELDWAFDIARTFTPSKYLVSPFNSTDNFLAEAYFLTTQQEDVKKQILDALCSTQGSVFISLTGAAGTGKTLLAYDIVSQLNRLGKATKIIHCGKLNEGHRTLIANGWSIISVRDLQQSDMVQTDVILVDEAQRIRDHQFSQLVDKMTTLRGKCIFAYDSSQTLADFETRQKVGDRIRQIPNVRHHSLSEKIRTNKEIANFIKAFFNIHPGLKSGSSGNIEVVYFVDTLDAINYINSIDSADWKVIKFTPSRFNKEQHESYSAWIQDTSHDVIGQEYDNVAVIVDKNFSRDQRGDLIYLASSYYQPVKMLFQNITRARSKLRLIIINNPIELNNCINIIQ